MLVPKEGGNSVSYVRFAGGGFSRFRDEASCWLPRFGAGSPPLTVVTLSSPCLSHPLASVGQA